MAQEAIKYFSWDRYEDVVVVRFGFKEVHNFNVYTEIAAELDIIANSEGIRALLINLEALEHFTSRFLGILLALSKRLTDRGRCLAVCRLRPEPMRVFAITRADRLISLYATEEEARAALMSGRRD